MGKAARRKRDRTVSAPSGRPRWAAAPGFDRAYFIASRYVAAYRDLAVASQRAKQPGLDPLGRARACRDEAAARVAVLDLRHDQVSRQLAVLEAAARLRGIDLDPDRPLPASKPVEDHELQHLDMAASFASVASDHLRHLDQAVPVVFDPLSVPEPSADALVGFGLPFPVTVADFLCPNGMSLPVAQHDGVTWVGLIAATLSQGEEGGPVDVWPTVTTMRADRPNDKQMPLELLYGRIRLGGSLPAPPAGLEHVRLDDGEAWVVTDPDSPEDDLATWAGIWLRTPALAAISALRLLDAVNVSLVDAPMDRAARRRAQREGAVPALKVDITTGGHASSTVPDGSQSIEWQHRWTVRGHWKHFGEQTAVARRHPSRVMDVPGHGRCVRVWCPPHVKGPADKPLVLKTRVVAHPQPVK
jgi:hypothetical protein